MIEYSKTTSVLVSDHPSWSLKQIVKTSSGWNHCHALYDVSYMNRLAMVSIRIHSSTVFVIDNCRLRKVSNTSPVFLVVLWSFISLTSIWPIIYLNFVVTRTKIKPVWPVTRPGFCAFCKRKQHNTTRTRPYP